MVEIRYLSAPEFGCTHVIIATGGEALVLKPSEALDLLASLEKDREPIEAALVGEERSQPEITPLAGLLTELITVEE